MSRLEAPSEPSMEEILAQIRKIIADEPIQARAEHAHIAAQRRVQTSRPYQPSPTPHEAPHQAPAQALEAIARLESVLNTPIDHAADDDLSDLVEPTAPESPAPVQIVQASEQPIVLEAVPAPAPLLDEILPVSTVAIDAPTAEQFDTEPIVETRADDASVSAAMARSDSMHLPAVETPAEAEPVADAMETALDTLAAGLASVSVKASHDLPPVTVAEATASLLSAEPPPADEEAPSAIDPETTAHVSEHESETLAPAAIDAIASGPEAAPALLPSVGDLTPSEPATFLPEASLPDQDQSITAAHAVPAPILLDATPAVETAIQPDHLVAESNDLQPAFTPTATPQFPDASTEATMVAPAPPSPAPVQAQAPQLEVSTSAAPAIADADDTSSNLDDTMADLLRPMLRQWLDENMPRIVERALRVEMAQMRKPKK